MLQFGGAAGTLRRSASTASTSPSGSRRCSTCTLPDAPWHTHRDRLAEVAAVLRHPRRHLRQDRPRRDADDADRSRRSVRAGAPGRGGSSTLPHKRNPVGAAAALSAATVAPNLVATILAAQVQEHERALGGWQTEWMTFPALALVTSGALSAVVEIAEGLEIDVERLRANLELSGGQIMAEAVSFALAEKIGRAEAHALVRELSQQAAQGEAPVQGRGARRPARQSATERDSRSKGCSCR